MATKIRLARGGAKKRPHYRVAPRDGDFLEKVGTYDPMLVRGDVNRVVLKSDRIEYWLSTGAQPTYRVARFIEEAGILLPASIKKKMKVKIKNRKIKPPKKESKKA